MDILSQLAPGIGDLFKLMVLTIIAVSIGLMVISMASSYEAMAMIDLGIDPASGSGPIRFGAEISRPAVP